MQFDSETCISFGNNDIVKEKPFSSFAPKPPPLLVVVVAVVVKSPLHEHQVKHITTCSTWCGKTQHIWGHQMPELRSQQKAKAGSAIAAENPSL